jgi:uncharacterized protein YeaO (DUF488 family)
MQAGLPTGMSNIHIRRIYDPPQANEGLRILVDRLWPRGVSKATAALDLWARDAAPSAGLREWFDHRHERFPEFERRYRDELTANAAFSELLAFVGRRNATLLFGAKDRECNQAVVLAEQLKRALPGARLDLASRLPAA